jgi:damage-control phosphatase, subfamily I
MKTLPECIGCFFAQLAKMSDLHGIDAKTHELMAKELARKVPEMDLGCSPPQLSRTVSDILIKHLKNDDPYLELKRMENKRAADMMDEVRSTIVNSADPLAMALKFAAAANVIDYGVPDHFALKHSAKELSEREFAVFDIETIKSKLSDASEILMLGDNTGEVFFDRLLLEQLPRSANTIYAVRSEPIINDVLLEDAREAGIDEFAEIVESGSHLPGTVPSICSEEFRTLYNRADIIISKGQGNFETLSEEKYPIIFLFAIKCHAVSKQTGHPKGSLMAMASPHFDWDKQ